MHSQVMHADSDQELEWMAGYADRHRWKSVQSTSGMSTVTGKSPSNLTVVAQRQGRQPRKVAPNTEDDLVRLRDYSP